MLRRLLSIVSLTIALMALGGCGSDVGNEGAVVGGFCVVNSECAIESRCLTGEAWPGGYCANLCESDEDCPSGSQCSDLEGGRCVVSCTGAADCRQDEGYDCVELAAGAGTVMGCALP